MVAPPSSRPRANSSKSLGLSDVTMPTALTQPRQFGSHATQLNRIGNLRSSRVTARAEPPGAATAPGNAIPSAAAPAASNREKIERLHQPQIWFLPPSSPLRAVATAPFHRHMILSCRRYWVKRVTVTVLIVHRTFAALPPKTCDICQSVADLVVPRRFRAREPRKSTHSDCSKPPMKHSSSPALCRLRQRGAAAAAQCRARRELALPGHAVAAGRLQLPPFADLFGLRRRGDRAFRPVGRRVDDTGAAIALPALGHPWNRQCAADTTAGRTMVSAVAVREVARRQRTAVLAQCRRGIAALPGTTASRGH